MKKILAVSTGGLGDTILFSPVIKALRDLDTKAEVDLLLANKLAREIYSPVKEIRKIHLVRLNFRSHLIKVAKLIPFMLQLRQRGGIDYAVFATGLNPYFHEILKKGIGIKQIFFAPTPNQKSNDLACNVILSKKINKSISESDVFVPITETSLLEAKISLRENGISIKRDRIVAIYPSTELKHRPRWGIEKIAGVVRRLKEEGCSNKFVVIGSRTEGSEWKRIVGSDLIDANLAGRLSITGNAALLNHCVLTIGNDGGLMQVAGAVDCPLVVIMTNAPVTYKPPGKRTKLIHSKLTCCDGIYPKRPKKCKIPNCTKDIAVNDVVDACQNLLNNLAP